MTRVLVTGATGFAGSHLIDALLARGGMEIHALRRWSSRMTNLEHIADVEQRISFHDCNLLDAAGVMSVVDRVRPDWIFHLGAESAVTPSWEMPSIYADTNINGTLNLLEAVRRLGLEPRVHCAGSGEEYGLVLPDEVPIREENPLRPVNPYAVTKVAQGMMCDVYHRSYGVYVVRTRTFNHEGPRRYKVFALPSFAYQIARIDAGLQEPILRVGNLTARRNWIDARDVALAYLGAIEKCPPGELFLIGSDTTCTVGECLETLLSFSSRRRDIRVEQDPARMRPTEVPLLVADSSKFRAATGWAPKIPLAQTLGDTLEYWRRYVEREQAAGSADGARR